MAEGFADKSRRGLAMTDYTTFYEKILIDSNKIFRASVYAAYKTSHLYKT